MKLSTRARYGLRMMVELARLLKSERLVNLGKVAKITGVSENYLAQLAMALKNRGLLIGVSGKKGGYHLAKQPENITVGEIIKAVNEPLIITDCVEHPDICLNSSFCDSRAVWVLVLKSMLTVLNNFTLADLIDKNWLPKIREEYPDLDLLNPELIISSKYDLERFRGCPVSLNDNQKEN